MPRPKKPGAPEPKRRSRKGCWPCKARKVKCGEEKPSCLNCQRQGETCDYSIRLNWDGRTKKKSISGVPQDQAELMTGIMNFNDNTTQSSPSVGTKNVQGDSSAMGESSFKVATPPDIKSGDNSAQKPTPTSPPSFQPQSSPRNSTGNHSGSPNDSLVKDTAIQPAQNHGSDSRGQSAHPSQPAGFPGDGISQPHISALISSGRYSYPSPTDSSLTSPIQGTTSFMGYHPVTQQISYLRQAHPPENQLTNSPTQEDNMLYEHITKGEASEGYSGYENFPLGDSEHAEMSTPTGMDDAHTTSYSHMLSPYSQHNIPSSLIHTSSSDGTPEKAAHIPRSHDPQIQPQDPVHSSSTQPKAPDGAPEFSSGALTSEEFGSKFNQAEIVDNFGLDCGQPDLDLNRNNDAIAIKDISSLDTTWQNDAGTSSPKTELGLQKSETVFAKGGYYSLPVLINIPRHLTPLPAVLLDNPMNLLYFHHFLNHTARILVPHDCSDNPFRVVLPSMAVEDTNLLNLLLAYSASHRARLLGHDEPSNRIAHWVTEVFPALRQVVDHVDEKTADTRVATALMLTSLKIISPSTFDVPIPWQDHLRVARSLFVARGGTQLGQPATKVGHFLARWLAYLDILGSLSCRKNDLPLFDGNYWAARIAEKGSSDECGFHVDCFTGFSARCSSLLARLGELTHHCYSERIDENGTLHWDFNPSVETQTAGERLLGDMNHALLQEYNPSAHHQLSKPDDPEIAASNKAFHWAGIIHLYRRVLDRDSSDRDVVSAVDALLHTLSQIRRGGSTEVCLLFPLFTAGCETRDPQHRNDILERIKSFEGVGMKQIRNARELMERSWAEDLPWILLTEGEFLG